MDALDHLGWVVHRSYEIGRMQFGVRTNSEACGEWLGETVSQYPGGARAHPPPPRRAGERRLAQFEHLQASERSDRIYVDAGVVRLGDVVGLVPPILPPYLGTLGHRVLERTGLELPVSAFVAIDAEPGRVVPPQRTLRVPADA